MAEEVSLPELRDPTPEEIGATCKCLRRLARDRVQRLPEEVHERVQSVTFTAERKGQPFSPEADIMEVKVEQISSPWISVELKDTTGTRHIRYLFNEKGDMTKGGNFTPFSEKPSSELGDELVHNIDFYEPLLEAGASEVSIRV